MLLPLGLLSFTLLVDASFGPSDAALAQDLRAALGDWPPTSEEEVQVLKRMLTDKPEDKLGAISAILGLKVPLTMEQFNQLNDVALSFIPEAKTGVKSLLGVDATDEQVTKTLRFILLKKHGVKAIISTLCGLTTPVTDAELKTMEAVLFDGVQGDKGEQLRAAFNGNWPKTTELEVEVLKTMLKDKPNDSLGAISAILGLPKPLTMDQFGQLDTLAKSVIPKAKPVVTKLLGLRVEPSDEEIIKCTRFISLQGQHGLKAIISTFCGVTTPVTDAELKTMEDVLFGGAPPTSQKTTTLSVTTRPYAPIGAMPGQADVFSPDLTTLARDGQWYDWYGGKWNTIGALGDFANWKVQVLDSLATAAPNDYKCVPGKCRPFSTVATKADGDFSISDVGQRQCGFQKHAMEMKGEIMVLTILTVDCDDPRRAYSPGEQKFRKFAKYLVSGMPSQKTTTLSVTTRPHAPIQPVARTSTSTPVRAASAPVSMPGRASDKIVRVQVKVNVNGGGTL